MNCKELEVGLWSNAPRECTKARVRFRGQRMDVFAGEACLTKVCVLLGVSNDNDAEIEREKVRALSQLPNPPDMVTDLSILRSPNPLYRSVIDELGCPVGTIPVYHVFRPATGINAAELLDVYRQQVEDGCSFFTLHCTSTAQLMRMAIEDRRLPTTSRGGGLVMRDIALRAGGTNVFEKIGDELAGLFAEHDCVASVASTFRASATPEVLDAVQLAEIEEQRRWVEFFAERGVQVMMEGPGHCPINRLQEYAQQTKQVIGVPMMDLGPVATDIGAGFDHVTAAIGLSVFGLFGGVDIINPVTRHEHTGGVPTLEAIIEALRTAQLVGHAIDMARLGYTRPDEEIHELRTSSETCVVGEPLEDALMAEREIRRACDRCRWTCPLVITEKVRV